MGERFFPNEIPEFLPEDVGEEETVSTHKDSLTKLLSLPYRSFSKKLQRYALSLKDTIVFETWERSGKRVRDFNLYTGVLGTAYLLFKSCQVTRNKNDLKLCLEIVEACYTSSKDSDRVTFICGRAGVCALGAVAAKLTGDSQLQDRYLARFHEIRLPSDLPYELLYGRAGYLWACLFLNKHIEKDCVSSARMRSVVEEIFRAGRQLGGRVKCPLMFEWHGKKYWGTAHGLAGIMHVLMHVELEPDEMEDVKGTLSYMIQHRFPSGNYLSSEGSESDRLVHWCHGAPGVALTLVKAAQEPFAAEVWISPQADLHSIAAWINQPRVNADAHATPVIKLYFQSAIYLLWKERNARVFTAVSSPSSVILASLDRMMCDRLLSYPVFRKDEFVEAAMEAGEVVWNGGLLKRVGICHGISGNTYVFLSLYRLTGKPEYLYRAKAFASFLLDKSEKLISEGKMQGGDRPFSLFEGIGGMAYMFLDMNEPTQALFPGYEL